ncbi:protein POLLENLESS 3-LIKE 2-like isoform X2 [Phalaenopsis equestris]|uniref:protein POLLENLESS 3-LIKE 2-like isoform X2 n=1 Tax=Phalaenopsis equestris TaxID=78828 RepID=UPI0009E37041|nr:protein POLLENLESS 3-LIKE 2-like isoform X2 [Phalaenopsis equestris]
MADKFNGSSFSDHAQLKIPAGDSPYVKAKHAQLVEKDPNKAVALFWFAINSADRVDSALKDMAVVMKQLNRAEEAIEAIKSFRGLCSVKAQEPLDNVLLDLYKKCGRVTEQIDLLNHKLKIIDEGAAFGGKIMKTARSRGKKFHVSVEQEKSRKALEIEKDYNKMCNLAICLMQTGRLAEAKILVSEVRRPADYCNGESYHKSFDRAWEMMNGSVQQQNSSSNEKTNTDHGEAFFSPASVRVTSNSKPLMTSESTIERKERDSGIENLVIRLDIQMRRAEREAFVFNCKKVAPLTSKDQNLNSSNLSTEGFQQEKGDEGAQICFESLDLSLGKTKKKTWADMVEDDEQSACENAEIGISSLKFAGRSWADVAEEEDKSEKLNFEFGSKTPTSSGKKLNRNETQKRTLNSSNTKNRSSGCKELRGRWRGMAKNDEGERRSSSSLKSCVDSDYFSGMGGRYGYVKQPNRLQVFQELTPRDAKA